MKIAIIGAGLAGLACADQLVRQGHHVILFDKARGPGGRMSTRRVQTDYGEASFDHGAQYFTVRDSHFRKTVLAWQAQNIAQPWPEAGPDAWVGVPSMNMPIKQMAAAHDVRWLAKVDGLKCDSMGWRLSVDGADTAYFDRLVIAVPAEQAATLLAPWDAGMARQASITLSMPCWTVMLAFEKPLSTAVKIYRDHGAVGWAACNRSKPGRTGPESWVIQASPDWSLTFLEAEANWVVETLKACFADCLGMNLPEPVSAIAHRWRYARSGAHGSGSHGSGALYNATLKLGACGDWLIGPRIESAWLSGYELAKMI
jgi:renalase